MIKFALALAAPALVAADAAPLLVSGDRTITATVAGLPARLRIDPGGPTIPVFNPDFATRAVFKAGWIGTAVKVGPIMVNGRSAVIRMDLGQGEFKRRVTWFGSDFLKGADGSIGPGMLPDDIIRFEMHAPQPGEKRVALPLANFTFSGMGYRFQIGGTDVRVRFTLERDRTIATAPLGAVIAQAHDGKFDRRPESMEIFLGVERPVRHMALARPLQIGPLSLDGMLVRTSDFGSTAAIPDADAPPPDPDEILVTGTKKQKGHMTLEIGRDYLDRCSSILFDKPAKLLTLSCR